MTDIWSAEFLIPIILPVVVAILIAVVAFRKDDRIDKTARAIAGSMVNEKIAMIYGYAKNADDWTDRDADLFTERIKSDLDALGKVGDFAESGDRKRLREAIGLLTKKIEPKFPNQSSKINSAFDSLKW